MKKVNLKCCLQGMFKQISRKAWCNMQISWKIRKQYAALRKSEKAVADYMLEHEDMVEQMTIAEIAEKSGVSQPTVMRFLQAIGYDSFREAKLAFATQRAEKNMGEQNRGLYGISLNPEDTIEEIPSKIIHNTITLLEDSLKRISVAELKKAIEAIKNGNRIVIYSVENSNTTASDLMTKLLYLGIPCMIYEDYYLQKISAGNLKEGDVAIGISYSGYSKNIVDVMKMAKKNKATTIVITNFTDTPLTEQADILIEISNQQFLYGNTIFSRTTHLAVVDMIYTGILLSDYQTYTKKMNQSSHIVHNEAYNNMDE